MNVKQWLEINSFTDGLNLDDVGIEALNEFICLDDEDQDGYGVGMRKQLQECLFPEIVGLDGLEVAAALFRYARCKRNAIQYRLKGEIGHAQCSERYCDEIYAGLPESVKW